MTTSNIFEYATRKALRFPYKGNQSVEELWNLPVTELDKIFKTLNSEVKQAKEESLLATSKSKEDEELEAMIAIVKHIVAVKLNEKEARDKASEKKAHKQKIMSIIAAKEDEALRNTSVEDLKQMLNELGD